MIRLGLYGCGRRTKTLLNSLIQDHFYRVEAAFDQNPSQAETMTAEFGGRICRTADELVASPDVDAFLISLSPFAHAAALKKTIPAGRPIFVEKPVAFTGAEVSGIADLAEQYHVPVQVGFMRRYLKETRTALDFIKQNDPGRIFCVDCSWLHHGDTEMNYCLYHQPDNFRLQVSQIPYHCCHMLDIMLLFGGPVQSVSSQLLKVTERPYPSPDDLIANVKFANGANGRFHYSSMVYHSQIAYWFNAENYSIKMNADGNNLAIFRRPRFQTSRLGPNPEKEKNFSSFNASYERNCGPEIINFSQGDDAATENIVYDFVRMVRDGVVPSADLRTAARVQGFAEAIELSGRLGRPVELDEKGIPV